MFSLLQSIFTFYVKHIIIRLSYFLLRRDFVSFPFPPFLFRQMKGVLSMAAKLSAQDSLKIAMELLLPLQEAFRLCPLQTAHLEDSTSYNRKIVTIHSEGVQVRHRNSSDETAVSITYQITYHNRIFEIYLTDTPEINGYASIIPDFDSETYLFCDVTELRKNGKIKYELGIGLNIEEGTLIELFEISFCNQKGLWRECKEIDFVEKKLKNKVILPLPVHQD